MKVMIAKLVMVLAPLVASTGVAQVAEQTSSPDTIVLTTYSCQKLADYLSLYTQAIVADISEIQTLQAERDRVYNTMPRDNYRVWELDEQLKEAREQYDTDLEIHAELWAKYKSQCIPEPVPPPREVPTTTEDLQAHFE